MLDSIEDEEHFRQTGFENTPDAAKKPQEKSELVVSINTVNTDN